MSVRQDGDQEIPLVRKYGVRNTPDWRSDSLYWQVRDGDWVHISNATIYATYGEAKFVADRFPVGHVAEIWTDK